MPKFFFDVTDGARRYVDREGMLLPDTQAARRVGAQVAKELAEDPIYDEFFVDVRDESGERVLHIQVSARH